MALCIKNGFLAAALVLVGLIMCSIQIIGAQSIGVCYGKAANNLPSDQDVINLYNANGIRKMRIYYPDKNIFKALNGSNIEIILGVPNQDLEALANSSIANGWVQDNIRSHFPYVKFKYISIGNKVSPTNNDQYSEFLLQAMKNVYNALAAAGLQDMIKVSTVTYSGVLANTYPPERSIFREEFKSFINPIIQFLARNNLPLLANVYPYFVHVSNTADVSLSYALFTQQGTNSAGYQNLFDAILDSMYFAVEKAGGPNVEIIVSESGWPSEGSSAATIENAQTYYRNLINHVKSGAGTPKKPGKTIETYLFAMFDENDKIGEITEKHFGLFSPDQRAKYQLNFNYLPIYILR
ncbi:glucan endo-1,3-beta-glucosidase, acidic isoform X2 [Nicotiana sylvestris]|uniref:Glucan endo-1,3-beta-glucosidase, acidic isoform GL161 n=1 Tax=Nicotiana sylvestris TaxID=4096 RepID=A0A1U7YQA6_NICSY|nr:PREDICTED: glucan endo-1,3-beta-glucosidase, acidic isoform GL161 [Nicotiana sylvestris]